MLDSGALQPKNIVYATFVNQHFTLFYFQLNLYILNSKVHLTLTSKLFSKLRYRYFVFEKQMQESIWLTFFDVIWHLHRWRRGRECSSAVNKHEWVYFKKFTLFTSFRQNKYCTVKIWQYLSIIMKLMITNGESGPPNANAQMPTITSIAQLNERTRCGPYFVISGLPMIRKIYISNISKPNSLSNKCKLKIQSKNLTHKTVASWQQNGSLIIKIHQLLCMWGSLNG